MVVLFTIRCLTAIEDDSGWIFDQKFHASFILNSDYNCFIFQIPLF